MRHEDAVPPTGERGWHKIAEFPDIVKWQYKDSPYRVVVHKNGRGHYEARFTSWFNGASYRIIGNCGGDEFGRLKAIVKAEAWMNEHPYGCAPPYKLAEEAGQLA
ncbi:hypothetical protein [Halorubellus litoreus]|uniref:Uncharacterized protein n=1 Tax=Halorubellus litoreus TaxID=755308 RepID=A0ABD5VGX7_9EURY